MPRKKLSEEERRMRRNAQYAERNKKSIDRITVLAHKRYRFREIMALAAEMSGAKSPNDFYLHALLDAAEKLGVTVDVLPPLPEPVEQEEAEEQDEME